MKVDYKACEIIKLKNEDSKGKGSRSAYSYLTSHLQKGVIEEHPEELTFVTEMINDANE